MPSYLLYDNEAMPSCFLWAVAFFWRNRLLITLSLWQMDIACV